MATTRPAPRRLRTGGPVTRQRRPPEGALRAGTAAPDFELHSTPDQTVRLSDFRAGQVILAFYPADWSPVCGDESALFKELLPEFGKHGAQLMGISVDRVWCHAAYAGIESCISPCWPTSNPRGPFQRSSVFTTPVRVIPTAPCSSSTGTGSSAGLTGRPRG
jgi:AhpC/TSA family protein